MAKKRATAILGMFETYLRKTGRVPRYNVIRAKAFLRAADPTRAIMPQLIQKIDRSAVAARKNLMVFLEFVEQEKVGRYQNDLPTMSQIVEKKRWGKRKSLYRAGSEIRIKVSPRTIEKLIAEIEPDALLVFSLLMNGAKRTELTKFRYQVNGNLIISRSGAAPVLKSCKKLLAHSKESISIFPLSSKKTVDRVLQKVNKITRHNDRLDTGLRAWQRAFIRRSLELGDTPELITRAHRMSFYRLKSFKFI